VTITFNASVNTVSVILEAVMLYIKTKILQYLCINDTLFIDFGHKKFRTVYNLHHKTDNKLWCIY